MTGFLEEKNSSRVVGIFKHTQTIFRIVISQMSVKTKVLKNDIFTFQ